MLMYYVCQGVLSFCKAEAVKAGHLKSIKMEKTVYICLHILLCMCPHTEAVKAGHLKSIKMEKAIYMYCVSYISVITAD
jgi:hypothetical protein